MHGTLKVTIRQAKALSREIQGKVDQADTMEATAKITRMTAMMINEVAGAGGHFGQIANRTAAKSYSGGTATIAAILTEISTFF